jgi:hypothetical protein
LSRQPIAKGIDTMSLIDSLLGAMSGAGGNGQSAAPNPLLQIALSMLANSGAGSAAGGANGGMGGAMGGLGGGMGGLGFYIIRFGVYTVVVVTELYIVMLALARASAFSG